MRINEARLRSAMAKQAISRSDLLRKTGMSSITLSRVMHGKDVYIKTVSKLAAALGVEPEYLLQMDNENDQQEAIKQAEQRDALIVRYTSLVRQLSEIPKGENWRDEYADLEKLLKTEIAEIRVKLGMDVK